MIFNKIYQKFNQGLKELENLKNINHLNKEQVFERFASLQNQFHELRTDVEIIHEKINDLIMMLSSNPKSS